MGKKSVKASDVIAKFQHVLDNDWGYIWGHHGDIWTAAKQKAAKDEQTKLYGSQWIGHYVSDCSGLFYWAFDQLGGYMYHGSNSMYLRYCTAKGSMTKGRRDDGQHMKPGTAVFCLRESDGVYSHVGLYIGNGDVIEAAGTKSGVIKSKVSNAKWEYWGELKGCIYDVDTDTPDVPPEDDIDKPTLRRGSKGVYVTALQKLLLAAGYDLGSYGVDGDYGRATEAAVRAFQKDNGLKQDGICGKNTWAALCQDDETLYTVTITGLTNGQVIQLQSQYPGKTTVVRG